MADNVAKDQGTKGPPGWLAALARSGLGIQGKFLLLTTAVIVAAVMGFSWFFIHHERAVVTEALLKRAQSLATNLAYNSQYGVLAKDSVGLSKLAAGIAREEDIVYAMVIDKDGTVLGHSLRSAIGKRTHIPPEMIGVVNDRECSRCHKLGEDDLLHVMVPVQTVKHDISREDLLLPDDESLDTSDAKSAKGNVRVERIGKAVVGVSLLNMERIMASAKAAVAMIALGIGCAAVIAVFLMTKAFVIPIQRLVQATERIASGDLDHTVEVHGNDELAELARSFNRMVTDLRGYHEEVENYSRTLEDKVQERTSDLEETNKTLRDTQAQLIQASKMAAMGQFGAGVAHELNQPLAGISGYTDLLLLKLDPDSAEYRYAKKIEDQCTRMTKIVGNLRTFARQSKFEYAETDINQPIDDALMLLGEQLRSHNIKLRRELTTGLPKVHGDANQLEQVFLNLITNAKDAMEAKGGGTLTLISRASESANFVEVLVADTGMGMDSATMADIFNPFFTTKDVGKGTGLGLSISLGILEDHGGRIEVHSLKGEGTVFRIALPSANEPPCWEMVDCGSSCGLKKEECPAFKNGKTHTCWEEVAKRLRRKGDPLPPNCRACAVYKRKLIKPLVECWKFDGVTVK
ncbi:MAG TPA: ATP-binding protein [bacterium]|nr:ATP-binding protein [bacterium]